MTNYAVGYVCGATCSSWFVGCLTELILAERPLVLQTISGPNLHRARADLAGTFLRTTDLDRLVMIDSDIVFSVAHVRALVAHREPVVTGVYMTSPTPGNPGEVHESGAGFLCIHRDVFEKLGPFPFDPVVAEDGGLTSEDLGFFRRARDAGFEVCVDGGISVGHAKTVILRAPRAG